MSLVTECPECGLFEVVEDDGQDAQVVLEVCDVCEGEEVPFSVESLRECEERLNRWEDAR